MTYKVFISYSTKDLPIVEHVRSLLQHSSIEVFVAEYSIAPGQSLPAEIITAIKNCNLFILLWSKNSKESEWVPQEIGIATSEKKPILPAVLHPDISLPGFIRELKYLPVYKNPEDALSWLRANVFERAQKKEQTDGLVWLCLGAAVIWLLSQK